MSMIRLTQTGAAEKLSQKKLSLEINLVHRQRKQLPLIVVSSVSRGRVGLHN
jgi:hypothetical protein